MKIKRRMFQFLRELFIVNHKKNDSFDHCIKQIVSRGKIALKDFLFRFHVYFCLQLLLQQKLQ
jgi:hypothetical protein